MVKLIDLILNDPNVSGKFKDAVLRSLDKKEKKGGKRN